MGRWNSTLLVIGFVVLWIGMSEGTEQFNLPVYPHPLRPRRSDPNTVVVWNSLHHGKNLKVHCKSKDDDLGLHVLPLGKFFAFTFKDNFFQTTLFWCNLWQGPNYKHHQRMVVYKAATFPRYGTVFLWDAREDGIYKSKDGEPPIFMYDWDVPHK